MRVATIGASFETRAAQMPPEAQGGDLGSRFKTLEPHETKQLKNKRDDMFSHVVRELGAHEQVLLLEVACGVDSILTSTVRELTKSANSAQRLSNWNDYDISSGRGVKGALDKTDPLQSRNRVALPGMWSVQRDAKHQPTYG